MKKLLLFLFSFGLLSVTQARFKWMKENIFN